MALRPLYTETAATLAALTRRGDVSCVEVIEAHLARIEAVNPAVNAATVVLADAALAAARAADGLPADQRGPLHGVPFTVKENIDCLGSPTTHGLPALRGALPYVDAPTVARLRAAGAIPIARTNQSELAMRLCTDNPLRGATRNPWDARLTAGGSSGGDAVAVATGMAPLGLGNDMGGSLRIPAHCAGVASLKPTTGRVPHAASLPPQDYGLASQLMLAHGPLARSVADLRLALGVLAGRDPRDPRSVDAPLRGPTARTAGLVPHLPGTPPATAAAIARAGDALRAAGWEVEEVDPPELDLLEAVWIALVSADVAAVLPAMTPFLSAPLIGHLDRLARLDPGLPPHRVHVERARLARRWSSLFGEHAVLIGPTWTQPVWPVDADLDPATGVDLLRATTRFIFPGSALGLPVVTLPLGEDDGLPTTVQIYADLWREDAALDAAAALEAGPVLPLDPRGLRRSG